MPPSTWLGHALGMGLHRGRRKSVTAPGSLIGSTYDTCWVWANDYNAALRLNSQRLVNLAITFVHCADVTLIFARGTCDPGNVGVLVGPPFFQAVSGAIGSKSLHVQGDAYPASVDGYLKADTGAGQTMAQIVRQTRSSCPKTKIVLSGYSQAGMTVHNAANALGGDMSHVSAAVTFGDPYSHKAVSNIEASKVHIVCHAGDDICNQGAIILPQHLTYAIDAACSASFVASKL
ncbi:hypothetical protein NQ176_g241 [Zarea fungicola]|uniref:Uncharacterized protein n=1 Tax=Zarea fungicola TaxID=93591 RepID=A0ACC1NYR6_9HYPO|nr:hypothetical protein NQ176_g241 [Lecanicillium fungicola]